MVVCKFFQQGYCRFGQNCRFEHVYGSKYSYHANAPAQAAPAPPVNDVTDEMLVKQVQNDLQGVLKGGQWILSCYSPYKEKPTFPGINDLSAEEARLFFYEARATNNLDQAIAYMNNLTKDARNKHEQLLQPNMAIIKVLRSLYKGEPTCSPFTTNVNQPQNSTSSDATSVFRGAVQNTPVINQGASPSIFGQNQNNIFETQNPSAAKSIFSQAAQNVFAQNQSPNSMFTNEEQNAPAAKSIFAQASQNIFGQTSPPQSNASSIFAQASQSVFGVNEQSSTFANSQPQNVFQKPEAQVGFGAPNVFQKQMADNIGIYTKIEDLMDDDLEAFQSASFQLGFVPEIAPPHSLCI